jgi:predicted ATPase
LRSLDVVPNNLPDHLTSFIGRDDEPREASHALSARSLPIADRRLPLGHAASADLRASVDWSHELLSQGSERCFADCRCSGWTLTTVEEVCAGNGIDRLAILDLLTSLVDRSMVTIDERKAAMRYRLLETVRQYAHERLMVSGGRGALRVRHRDAFLALAEEIAAPARSRAAPLAGRARRRGGQPRTGDRPRGAD